MKTLAEILFEQRLAKAQQCADRALMHGVDTPHGRDYLAMESHWLTAALIADRGTTGEVVTVEVDREGEREVCRVIKVGVIVERNTFTSYAAALEWGRLTARMIREGQRAA